MSRKIDKLLLHKQTAMQIEAFVQAPSHALMILGAVGSGKKTIAKAIAAQLLQIGVETVESYPFFLNIASEEKKEISIDQIRNLINKLRLKTPGTKSIRRVAFIESADNMSLEAQNALLKFLEEPSEDTVFILTATSDRTVLPTIASRAQHIYVRPVSIRDVCQYYQDRYPSAELERAWSLSLGSVGLLSALLNDSENHALKTAVGAAKSFLHQSQYERILSLESIGRDRSQFQTFLNALNKVVTSLHHTAVKKGRNAQAIKLLGDRKLINNLIDGLNSNAATKFITLKLVMNLSI